MSQHISNRAVVMLVGFFIFIAAVTFNSLSRFGAKSGIFIQSTEDVIRKYSTPFTPKEWTFFVWEFIYIWIFAMFFYFLSGLCRRKAYDWMYTTPAALPYGFHILVIANLCFNITFLFLFDREKMFCVLVISVFMNITDYGVLFFSCHGLKIYGAWLNKYHWRDLWLYRILVQNGIAVYTTWGTLSTLLNLTIFLEHEPGTSNCHCASVAQLLLLMEIIVWFLFENFYFDEHVRYILTIYPIVILWLSGNIDNLEPGTLNFFLGVFTLALCCLLFLARIVLVSWKHYNRPLYSDTEPYISPVEKALTQSKLFL